ncbi:hypothetical protein [Caproicibacter fermentans]|uniref:Uncharacterized protein n=1 Tax=Caproicibacter fermentans TaxID=2576756 RepID=A0A7G8TF03_9FIRM|nr:hypothetical protein [Caproicibacter fermentans]QNK42194.1 hypothetical protein HCR03_08290 [Caproicibacter fermentans]
MDFFQGRPCEKDGEASQRHKKFQAVKMADVRKRIFFKQFRRQSAFLKYGVGYAVGDKFRKLRLYRFKGKIVQHTAFIPHLEVFHVLRQEFPYPSLNELIQANLDAGGGSVVFLMEFNQQTGLILILQLPQVAQNLLKALFVAVGIHEVKQVFQTDLGIRHINDGDTLCSAVDIPLDPLIVPFVIGGKLSCVGALCINQYSVVKRALIESCHAGQQTFPFRRVFRIFLHRLFIYVGKKGCLTQDAASLF